MTVDPRTPVLVGIGEATQRPEQVGLDRSVEPVELLKRAVDLAAVDAGNEHLASLVRHIGTVPVVKHPYTNLSESLGALLGVEAHYVRATHGGDGPQRLIEHACLAIQTEGLDVALVGSVECGSSERMAGRSGVGLGWPKRDGLHEPHETVGYQASVHGTLEQNARLRWPINYYPLFEHSYARAHDKSATQTVQRIGHMWERFARVAADVELAWDHSAASAAELTTVSDVNRMISTPYVRRVCSNDHVDLSAALLFMSYEAAVRHGIPADRMVFPTLATTGHDAWSMLERPSLHESVAMRQASIALTADLGVAPNEFDAFDLYSCFPIAVTMAIHAFDLDPQSQLTLTGGLPFFGGPWNGYVTHSTAAMARWAREHPQGRGLVTANGGMAHKHGAMVWSSSAPATPFRVIDTQVAIDRVPLVATSPLLPPSGEVETLSVAFGKDGPREAWIVVRDAGGTRSLAHVASPDEAMRFVDADLWLGKTVRSTIDRIELT